MKRLLLLISLVLFGVFASTSTDEDAFVVHYKWTNNSPCVYALDDAGITLDVPEFISQFPWYVAPHSSVEFNFSRNMTCSGCINVIQYQALLGAIGDIPNINTGLSSPVDDYINQVKRVGTLQIHYMNEDRDAYTIGIVSESYDLLMRTSHSLIVALCLKQEQTHGTILKVSSEWWETLCF